MTGNMPKIRFDDENLKYLYSIARREAKPLTYIINREISNRRKSMLLSDFLTAVEHPVVYRMKSSSTNTDLHRLCTLIRSGMVEHLVFGVRECDLNDRVLTGFIECNGFVVVFDGLYITHAREARIMEVEDLMRVLGSARLSCAVSLIRDPVKPTGEDSVENAWSYYRSLSVTPFDLSKFLALIAPTQCHDNLLRYLPDDGYCIKLEKNNDYGRGDLMSMRCFDNKEAAESVFDAITKKSRGEDTNATHLLTLSYFGRPERWEAISMANIRIEYDHSRDAEK